jgi:hypothetical protein
LQWRCAAKGSKDSIKWAGSRTPIIVQHSSCTRTPAAVLSALDRQLPYSCCWGVRSRAMELWAAHEERPIIKESTSCDVPAGMNCAGKWCGMCSAPSTCCTDRGQKLGLRISSMAIQEPPTPQRCCVAPRILAVGSAAEQAWTGCLSRAPSAHRPAPAPVSTGHHQGQYVVQGQQGSGHWRAKD